MSEEVCGGCGASSPFHPVLAVMHKDHAPEGSTVIDNPDDDSDFVGVTVCDACHRDPTHRSKDKLKAHFFERKGNTAKIALMLAGSSDIQG
jgi:hypothetical protein